MEKKGLKEGSSEEQTQEDKMEEKQTDRSEAETGNSLIDAILNKYGDMESGLHDLGEVKVYFSAPAKKTQSEGDCSTETQTLKLPNILVLNRCDISKAGDRERLAELCQPVQELDLAENSLQCWSEIGAIASEIPNLEFLNLSSNPLYKAPTQDGALVSMATVRRLVLNDTKTPWDMVHSILEATPSLNELHLSLNEFTTVTESPNRHSSVKLLQFNNNQISNWSEVQKLGRMFPNLETLVLMENEIKTLDNCSPSEIFPNLKMLCLSDTLVDSWDELDKLNSFPSLTEILVMGIPLLRVESNESRGTSEANSSQKAIEEEKKKIRQLVIARLGKLTRLNRSKITESERETAERVCIRMFKHSEEKPPRYDELVEKHGQLHDLAKVNLKPQTNFRCRIQIEDNFVDEQVDVNIKHTVQQLRKQLAQIVKLPATKIKVFLVELEYDQNGVDFLELVTELTLITSMSRYLHTYRIDNDTYFKIVPK